jgi:hypothetical protein
MTYTIPSTGKLALISHGCTDDLNDAYSVLDSLGKSSVLNEAYAGGAAVGASNVTPVFNAVPGGARIRVPGGTYQLNDSSSVNVNAASTVFEGDGRGPSVVKLGSSFSAAQAFAITAALCGIRDLSIVGANSTTTSNPVAKGVQATAAQRLSLRDLFFQYINGYAIDLLATSTFNADAMIGRIVARNCAGGLHLKGVTGSSFLGENFLSEIQLQQMGVSSGASANLDAILVEDSQDMQFQSVNIGMVAGTGSAFHIKGPCSSVMMSNPDLGMATTGAPCVFIEADANGVPSGISFVGGVIQNGLNALKITAGVDIKFIGVTFKGSTGSNVVITGGTAGGQCDNIRFFGCTFKTGGQGGGTCYDIDLNGMVTGWAYFQNCSFESAIGSGAGFITNPVNDTGHRGIFESCSFRGLNNTPSTVFSSGGTPQIIRNSTGYSPRGNITAPTITTGVFTTTTSQHDVMIIFTSIGGMTAFKIGSTSVGVLPVAGVPYYLGARTSLEVDSATTAPTWQWFAL